MDNEKILFNHIPVMLHEATDALLVAEKPNGTFVDCTTGGGGHSYEIARKLGKDGRLICIDRDIEAITAASERLSEFSDKITFKNENFSDLLQVIGETKIDGILIDLGVSSYQLDNPERGFSYMQDAPLDMRMDRSEKLTAYDIVNGYDKDRLIGILRDYGEERMAGKIATYIVNARSDSPIKTTAELARLVQKAVGAGGAKDGGHPAKRTFQAIRIEVNNELAIISQTINDAVSALRSGGRLSIITFHSLEDRIVKQTFAELSRSCICPPRLPICACNVTAKVKIISKAVQPSSAELSQNSRSKSAKLRVCEKL